MKPETPDYVRQLAKKMRIALTPAEDRLWQKLRRNSLLGCKFYRQYPIGRYIADFCCPEKQVIIELDGYIHNSERNIARDRVRDKTLHCEGITVLRFRNEQVMENIDNVIHMIEISLLRPTPMNNPDHQESTEFQTQPLPLEGGGVGGEGSTGVGKEEKK